MARQFETFQTINKGNLLQPVCNCQHQKPQKQLSGKVSGPRYLPRPRLPALVVRPELSRTTAGGGPTESRFFSSVGRSTFFGADRSPSTLCNRSRAAVAPN